MISRAVTAGTRGNLLQEFIPCPTDLSNTIAGYFGIDTAIQAEMEAKVRANQEKYGYSTWYEFSLARWGCKWDVECSIGSQDANTVTMTFDSAWAPPTAAYRELAELGFDVTAYYYEPGMAFCGKFTSQGDNETYNIEGDSAWVLANIPTDIDQALAISEQMADYEAEEDLYEHDSDEQEDDETDLTPNSQ